jgi:hypothetical protein
MRTKIVECKYRYQAVKDCPWASRTAKVTDGYICFESIDDYKIWKNQK